MGLRQLRDAAEGELDGNLPEREMRRIENIWYLRAGLSDPSIPLRELSRLLRRY